MDLTTVLKGRRTYISIAIFAVGFFGVAQFVTEAEVGQLVDAVLGIVGIVGAIYGRYNANK